MAPKLYMMKLAAPSRSVLLTAKALNVDLELISINLTLNEQLKPEYLKLNPQHTIPTLDDDGKIIWDSHAINAYLVSKYGSDDSLYPSDPYKRAVINQRLHFDTGVLFYTGLKIIMPILRNETKTIAPELKDEIMEAYELLEKFLVGNLWAAGDSVTLADLNLIPSVTNVAVLVPIDYKKFPNISAWLKRAESLPYYVANQEGLDNFKAVVQTRLNS